MQTHIKDGSHIHTQQDPHRCYKDCAPLQNTLLGEETGFAASSPGDDTVVPIESPNVQHKLHNTITSYKVTPEGNCSHYQQVLCPSSFGMLAAAGH